MLLSPVLLFVLAAMAVDRIVVRRDRGTFLYRETRVSRGGEFGLLKFRTLRREALRRQAGDEAHARLLEADAENLTWTGRRILKPWYLDELPQLLNVLKGDMSLVGPRPWPPSLAAASSRKASATGTRSRPAGRARSGAEGVTSPRATRSSTSHTWMRAAREPARLVRYDLGILWQTVKLMARGEGLRY